VGQRYLIIPNFAEGKITFINSMNWQEILLILLAIAAAFYLYRKLRSSVKDHDCGDCALNESKKEPRI